MTAVSRCFHRAVGASRELDLLGQWFWRAAEEASWVPYSAAASWDLEVALCLDEPAATVAVCECQEGGGRRGGKPRRRHVRVDLLALKQRNLNGRGREIAVLRRPRLVVGHDDGDLDARAAR